MSNKIYGRGTETEPFWSEDGTAGIADALAQRSERGGKIYLPVGRYDLSKTVEIDTSCIKLEGEVWNYSSDPNGVFESAYGTKLRLTGRDFPAISVAPHRMVGGVYITDIGVQGDINGMDTRPLFQKEYPAASAGLHFSGERIDQGEFSKLSFCGLSSAICATKQTEIDGTTFERINTDGCCVGIYYAPRASYYVRFRHCVVADTPSYGFYLCGKDATMHNIDIYDLHLVRNCGSMPGGNDDTAAAIFFDGASGCAVRDCTIDYAGTFWYYDESAVSNNERQISRTPTVGIRIHGDKNRLIGNTVLHSKWESIIIEGNANVLSGNLVDGSVVVDGEGNTVSNLIFTKPEARLILRGAAKDTTAVFGVPEDKIIKE